jgi:DNA-binding NarL/FixJ family response regulator
MSDLSKLSQREIQVMLAMAHDYNNKEIAYMLGLSRKTIEHHRMHLYRKLKRNSAVSITRFAIARGYVSLAEEGK